MTSLFLKVFNMSISASYLILAVLIARILLKKAPKWVSAALWAVVGLRLICPFSPESALSLIPSAQTVPETIVLSPTPALDTGFAGLDQVVNPALSQIAAPQAEASINPMQVYLSIAAWVWVMGMATMLLYTVISYFRLDIKMETSVRYWGNVYQSENVASPFVLGLFRPRIYLPYSLDDKTMEHVIAHEQAHIQRRDHWWKPLAFLLVSIHWFNPLLWLAYVLLCRDIELACDEKVIRGLSYRQRADYSQALLICSLHRRPFSACPLAFGEIGVKDRVKSILHYRKPTFWILLVSGIVCAVLVVCFLTNPKEEPLLLETHPQTETVEPTTRTEPLPSEETTPIFTELTYEADAASRGVLTSPPEKPYLAVYRIDPVYGELTEYIPLTDTQAAAIQSEPLNPLHRGYGFGANLYTNEGDAIYTEISGAPQTVLDLAIAQCKYTFATPEDIGTIVDARFDCPWLEQPIYANEEDLPRLEEILKNAAFGYMGSCGYGAYLHLTMADGNTLTVVKGTDGCDSIAFGSWGGYFLGDSENTEFWHIFSLDETDHLPLTD